MEEISKCPGCIEDAQVYPCPHCGYDPQKEQDMGYALMPGTIRISTW